MIVVADASPINYLLEIGHIDALSRLFAEVIIPHSVFLELTDVRGPADALRALQQTRFFASEELMASALDRWGKWKASR